uniref:ATP-dependent DNA helicase n=1 Tax=Strongyloides papillosus TaxID=174720 RepID=A0A0N5C4P2_STREA
MDFKTWKCPICKDRVLCSDYKEHSSMGWNHLKQNAIFTCYDCIDEFEEYSNGRKMRQLSRREFKQHLKRTHKKVFNVENEVNRVVETVVVEEAGDEEVVDGEVVDDASINLVSLIENPSIENLIKIHRTNDKDFVLMDLLFVKSSEDLIKYTISKYGMSTCREVISNFTRQCTSTIKPKITVIDLDFDEEEIVSEIGNQEGTWTSTILDKDDLSNKEGFEDYKKFLVREARRAKLYCGDLEEILERNLTLFKTELDEDVVDVDMFFDEFTIASVCAPGITYKTMVNIALRLPAVYQKNKTSNRCSVISFVVALSSFSREDKHSGLVREAISLINNKKIVLQNKERTLRVKALISDNGYSQYLLGTSGNFTVRGENVCRFCTLRNHQFSEFYTCSSINAEEIRRNEPLVSYLPISLYWTADILHDLSLGVIAYSNYRTIAYLVKVFSCDVKKLVAKLNSHLKKSEEGKFTSVLKDEDVLRKLNSARNWSFIEKKFKFNLSGSQQNALSRSLERYLSEYVNEIKEKCTHSVVVKKMCHCKVFSELQFLHENLNETYKYLISRDKNNKDINLKIDNVLRTIKSTTSDDYKFALKEHLLGHYPFLLVIDRIGLLL